LYFVYDFNSNSNLITVVAGIDPKVYNDDNDALQCNINSKLFTINVWSMLGEHIVGKNVEWSDDQTAVVVRINGN